MKKLLIFAFMVFAIIAVCNQHSVILEKLRMHQEPFGWHKMVRKDTVYYDKTDSPYRFYGTYKEIYRRYNYPYYDSTYDLGVRPDDMHGISYFINEYGDTVLCIYTDYTNFPRRED